MMERINEDTQVLCNAVKNGNLKIVEGLLKDGADVDTIDSTYRIGGVTLLHSAVHERQVEMVKLLIKYGANVNVKDCHGMTPIDTALENWDIEMADLLQINGAEMKEDNALHVSVRNGNVEIVEDLLKDGDNVNTIDSTYNRRGMTVLPSAVRERQMEMAKLLIQKGANVNVKSRRGTTPLADALRNKDTKMVDLLLTNGADVKEDPNILYAAVDNGNLDIVEEILKDCVDVNMIDSKNYVEGKTLLHNVVRWKNVEMAKLLIKHGANINVRDSWGTTPLVTAIYNWDTQMTRLLLFNGADIKEDNILSFLRAILLIREMP